MEAALLYALYDIHTVNTFGCVCAVHRPATETVVHQTAITSVLSHHRMKVYYLSLAGIVRRSCDLGVASFTVVSIVSW